MGRNTPTNKKSVSSNTTSGATSSTSSSATIPVSNPRRGGGGGKGGNNPSARTILTYQRRISFIRHTLLAGVLGYMAQKHFLRELLLPYGGPVADTAPSFKIGYSPIDYTNDLLQFKHGRTQRIYERLGDKAAVPLMHGPETVVFDHADGGMYVLTETAKLVRLSDFQLHETEQYALTAKTEVVKDLGMGRPLGGAFSYPSSNKKQQNSKNKRTLYIADAVLGLTRITDVLDPYSKIEIVASHVMDDRIIVYKYENGTTEEVVESIMTPILYADDVTIGPKSGKVYFTDASNIPADRILVKSSTKIDKKKLKYQKKAISVEQITPHYPEFRWDTLYASKVDLSRKIGTGRLLEYDPKTDQIRVLLRGFYFSNGIAITDENEEAIFFTETFGIRIYKYNIQAQTLDVLVDSNALPGYLDGADCVLKINGNKDLKDVDDGVCYAVMPSAILPIVKFIDSMPPLLNRLFRTIIMILPRKLAPKVATFGGLIEVNPKTGNHRLLLDPHGHDLRFLTGVTHYQGKLYFGSLENDFVGVYDISKRNDDFLKHATTEATKTA